LEKDGVQEDHDGTVFFQRDKRPILELSQDTGYRIAIDLSPVFSPANLSIIYDVLKKKAGLAGLRSSRVEFFTDPGVIAARGNMLPIPEPEPYTLPLTLRVDRGSFIIWSVICMPLIAATLYFGIILNPPPNMQTWVLLLLIIAILGISYLVLIMPRIRLTEDRIFYRDLFFWKEIQYERITGIRFSSHYHSLVLELPQDTDHKITINLSPVISPANLSIIYDVLKKRAGLADFHTSSVEFFAVPGATAVIVFA
jgi:uncharacterized membrane protein YobD (UPF0266 family)